MTFDGLPGGDRITQGLRDLREARTTPEALLVATASIRLRAFGLEVPPSPVDDPQLQLYVALGELGIEDPYGTYNAWLRELTSFLEAMERRASSKAKSRDT